jgi:hypothetical protein
MYSCVLAAGTGSEPKSKLVNIVMVKITDNAKPELPDKLCDKCCGKLLVVATLLDPAYYCFTCDSFEYPKINKDE